MDYYYFYFYYHYYSVFYNVIISTDISNVAGHGVMNFNLCIYCGALKCAV